MHWLKATLLAMAMMAAPAHAYIDVDFTADIFQPPPGGWRYSEDTAELPCSIDGNPSFGLPPCAITLTPREKSRQKAAGIQHVCRNVASAHGYITVCSSVPVGR